MNGAVTPHNSLDELVYHFKDATHVRSCGTMFYASAHWSEW